MAACEHIQDELSAYLDGELPEQERAAVDGHLKACAACRAMLAELQEVHGSLSELPKLAAPATFAARVHDEAASTPVHAGVASSSKVISAPTPWQRKLFGMPGLVGLAAMVMVAVMVFAVLPRLKRNESEVAVTSPAAKTWREPAAAPVTAAPAYDSKSDAPAGAYKRESDVASLPTPAEPEAMDRNAASEQKQAGEQHVERLKSGEKSEKKSVVGGGGANIDPAASDERRRELQKATASKEGDKAAKDGLARAEDSAAPGKPRSDMANRAPDQESLDRLESRKQLEYGAPGRKSGTAEKMPSAPGRQSPAAASSAVPEELSADKSTRDRVVQDAAQRESGKAAQPEARGNAPFAPAPSAVPPAVEKPGRQDNASKVAKTGESESADGAGLAGRIGSDEAKSKDARLSMADGKIAEPKGKAATPRAGEKGEETGPAITELRGIDSIDNPGKFDPQDHAAVDNQKKSAASGPGAGTVRIDRDAPRAAGVKPAEAAALAQARTNETVVIQSARPAETYARILTLAQKSGVTVASADAKDRRAHGAAKDEAVTKRADDKKTDLRKTENVEAKSQESARRSTRQTYRIRVPAEKREQLLAELHQLVVTGEKEKLHSNEIQDKNLKALDDETPKANSSNGQRALAEGEALEQGKPAAQLGKAIEQSLQEEDAHAESDIVVVIETIVSE